MLKGVVASWGIVPSSHQGTWRKLETELSNKGALTIRIGFWCILYFTYNKEPSEQYWYLFRPLYCCGRGLKVPRASTYFEVFKDV